MANKAHVSTPFSAAGTAPGLKGNPGTYDRHRTPILDKPHSMGKDTIPLRFFESGKHLEPNPQKFKTPFGTTLEVKGTKRGV